METVLTKISDIRMNPSNPRVIKDAKFKQLVQSIKDFPQILEIRPIVVNDEMIVLGGNMRLKACKEAKLTEVPVIMAADLTPDQQREFIIKDNVGFGEWDIAMLAKEWKQEELERWGLDVEFAKEPESAPLEDDFDPIIPKKTDIVEGDLFEISSANSTHRLFCGSATDPKSYEALMGNTKAHMAFTDPPYLMNFQGGMSGDGSHTEKHEVILNDNLGKEEGDQFLKDFLAPFKQRVMGAWYISFYRLGIDRMFRALDASGMKWRNLIIWKKNHKNLSNSDYQSIYEPIFYGFGDDYIPIVYGLEKKHEFRGQKGVQNDVVDDIGVPSIWEIDRTKVNDLHPTMKPVELVGRCLINSCRPGDTVLDVFLGSGTTMVAAHQLKRNCVGFELDPRYCEVILERMKALDPEICIFRNWKPYGKE